MPRSPRRFQGAPFLSLALVTSAVASTLLEAREVPFEPRFDLCLDVSPVPLDPTCPRRETVGGLRYLGGLRLRAEDPRFGGLSDLRVSSDGGTLFAVSDCGRGFVASLEYDDGGRLGGMDAAYMVDLAGRDGRPLRAAARDAESVVILADALLVGFEGSNRILSYALTPPFGGAARALPAPAGVRGCLSNGGLEAMETFGDRRLFLACEARRSPSLDVPAWTGRRSEWSERGYPLLFEGGWAGEPFRPTAAAMLANGDLLVLERRFPPIGARVVRIPGSEVAGTGPLHPAQVARFEAPLTLDNFEGLATRQDGDRTLVYLLSDDNNCAKTVLPRRPSVQRTLLLMFSLES